MRVMYNSLIEVIEKYDTIVIARHIGVDPDALCSQLALRDTIRLNYPNKKVLAIGTGSAKFAHIGRLDKLETVENALLIVTDTPDKKRVDSVDFSQFSSIVKIDHHPNDDVYGDICWVNTQASSCSEIIYDFYAACQAELTLPASAAMVLYAGIVGDTGRFMYDATTPHTLRVAAALVETEVSAGL